MSRLWRDRQFLAALTAGPVVWEALIWNNPAVLDMVWPLRAPLTFLLLALVYPVAEELIFRGAVQEALFARGWGRRALGPLSLANFITSLLFSGAHLIQHPPLWAALVFIPSLLFGYFRDRYQTLQAPISLHIFYNAGYFWLFPP